MAESRSSTSVILGGKCNLTCTVCDCHDEPAPVDAEGVPELVREGGDKLTLRGEPAVDKAFVRTLDVARGAWSEVTIRTNGQLFADRARAEALRARGVRAAIVPLFAHVARVHDSVAGKPDALVTALRAMRALADAGIAVSVEVPLLPTKIQNLAEVARLAVRAVPSLAGVRFYVPAAVQPPVLAPPRWSSVRASLLEALGVVRDAGLSAELREYDGVPLCALGHDPEGEVMYRFRPDKPVRRRGSHTYPPGCASCVVQTHCVGVARSYRAAHGEADLVPFTTRPRRMLEQRTTARRVWDASQRAAASQATVRVLRPTVNCNQDCPFCSANETSDNLLTDRTEMLKRIARVARQRVQRLSFGGGEPTLSKDLVEYVRAAARLGVPKIEIVTNGVLIDSPEKVRPFREAGLTHAFVSLHAHDELLSQRMTSKVGDWARTVRAIDALIAAGVETSINHVINAVNYPYLPRFAEFLVQRWPGRVATSFAFVTPQFRALENLSLVPKISDVVPYLRAAMRTMEKHGQQFVVGSRQGIPPCFLGEFEGFSDIFQVAGNALSEDVPQKSRAPGCDSCRYSSMCTGLWKPYVARYGIREISPVPGGPLSDEESRAIHEVLDGRDPVVRFAQLPEILRRRDREGLEDALPEPPTLTPATARSRGRVSLPMAPSITASEANRGASTEETRVVLLGTGPQAERIARAAQQVRGLRIVGAASPHLLERPPGAFASLSLGADPGALLEALAPDAVIIAAATLAHHSLAQLCMARKLPVLIEKPLAQSLAQADELVRMADGSFVMTAHGMLFSPGMRALRETVAEPEFGPAAEVGCVRCATASSPEALPTWSREGLYQVLYHSVYLAAAAAGGGGGAATVVRAEARGTDRPEWVRAELVYPSGAKGEIVLDFAAPVAGVEVWAHSARGRSVRCRREGADESITRETEMGERTFSLERGNDLAGMLSVWRDALRARTAPPVTARDGRDAMFTAQAIVTALAAHFTRPGAPRHAASPALR